MTFNELEALLIQNNIPKNLYKINETPEDNCYCIIFDGKVTEVFYFERGLQLEYQSFTDKNKGMEYFIDKLVCKS